MMNTITEQTLVVNEQVTRQSVKKQIKKRQVATRFYDNAVLNVITVIFNSLPQEIFELQPTQSRQMKQVTTVIHVCTIVSN